MKKIIIYSVGLLSAISLTSCNSILEEETDSFPSQSVIYSNDQGVEAALTGCYSGLISYNVFQSDYHTIFCTAGGTMNNTSSSYNDSKAQRTEPDNKYIGRHFKTNYRVIADCNDLLDKIDGSGASEALKTRAKGEAHLLRGMIYFNLVRAFGGLPLRLTPITSTNLDMPRSSVEDTYKQVIADLEEAAQLLPEKNPTEGRPNRYAAHALLARVYSTLANGEEGSPYWQKCIDECQQVYGHYQLVPLQTLYSAQSRNTAESIIEIQFSDINGSTWTQGIAPDVSDFTPNSSSNPYGRYRPSKYIFDTWREQYPGDPRIEQGIIYNYYTKNGGVDTVKIYPAYTSDKGSSRMWPYLKKFLDTRYVAQYTAQNFMYLRYADVLLMMAEATNEVSGPDKAYQYVNEVLARARNSAETPTTEPADWSGMTKEQFRHRIMYERFFELLGEETEYFDMRRRGPEFMLEYWKAHNAHPANCPNPSSTKYKEDYFVCTPEMAKRAMLLPFPTLEINSNNSITDADQNPGY
jgi:hypothetical protein